MDHIELFNKMIEYYEGDPKRIQHFTKVFEYCRLIGIMENIPEKEQFALETTALVHDIGIKKQKKYMEKEIVVENYRKNLDLKLLKKC